MSIQEITNERKAKAPARIAECKRRVDLLEKLGREYYKAGNQTLLLRVRKVKEVWSLREREFKWDLAL